MSESLSWIKCTALVSELESNGAIVNYSLEDWSFEFSVSA